jgi:hypothetical protein
MIELHDPGSCRRIPAAPKIETPMRRTQLRHGCRLLIRHARKRLGRNAPTRDCRDRLRTLLLGRFPRPPTPQQEAGNARLFRRQLEAARGIHCQSANLSDNCAQGTAAQSLLEGPAHFRITAGGDEDQPPQIKAEGGKTRRIEIGILCDPGDPSRRCIGSQGQGKEAGARCSLFLVAGMARNFMDRAEWNGGFAQISIDASHPG